MALQFEIHGDRAKPVLFCLHGLLGGPENFRGMLERWYDHFCPIIVDLHAHMRAGGLIEITEKSMSNLSYDGAAKQILEFLDRDFPGRSAYFAGLSLGGKISYEFVGLAPERFLGAVVTDVGPGMVKDSSLYQFVAKTVPQINLNQAWPQLKQELTEKVPDRNMRVMLQTQIHYPVKDGPATWRAGITALKDLLDTQAITDQWAGMASYRAFLEANPSHSGRRFIVFKANALSAVSEEQVNRMRELPFMDIRPVTGTSHFVHVTHRREIEEAVLSMLVRTTQCATVPSTASGEGQ